MSFAPLTPKASRTAASCVGAAGLALLFGLLSPACQPPRAIYFFEKPAAEPEEEASERQAEEPVSEKKPPPPKPDYAPFELKPAPEVECKVAEKVDVNLGHTPEALVKAAYCQTAGKPAPEEVVAEWAEKLRTDKHTRRIDVVRTFCDQHKHSCELVYSDP